MTKLLKICVSNEGIKKLKINRFGINLDEGLALTEETLDKFYVYCFKDEPQKIIAWLKNNTIETPLLFGGQIGSGKSTLITKIFSDKSLKREDRVKSFKMTNDSIPGPDRRAPTHNRDSANTVRHGV